VVALLLLAPSIPELLTGSTPITTLFYDPLLFAISFAGIVGLYGGGALLIREFVVRYRKGWASVLLLGAAYGIGEEGFAVHTFFETSGPPVNALGVYGHAFGVNWLWAFGLSVFHATYSIALPILLVGLFYPASREVRWLDRRGIALTGFVYLFVVVLFSVVVGHGPTPATFALFLGIAIALIALAGWVPRELLRPRPGPARTRPAGIAVAAALPFLAWTGILIFSDHPVVPAVGAGLLLAAVGLLALLVILRFGGDEQPTWTKFYIATGMLGILFVWDGIVEFEIPGILLVTAIFVYLLYRLRRNLLRQEAQPPDAVRGVSRPLT
jgi:hypothetical protein